MPGESARTAWLDDGLHVWRHLLHMLTGEEPIVRRVEDASLRPPLEPAPEEGGVATVPLRCEGGRLLLDLARMASRAA